MIVTQMLNNNVLLKKIPKESPTGKLLVENIEPEISYNCEVIAKPDNVYNCNVGDVVLITSFAGNKVDINGEEYISVNANQLIAIL